jgi:hypothetical protein
VLLAVQELYYAIRVDPKFPKHLYPQLSKRVRIPKAKAPCFIFTDA